MSVRNIHLATILILLNVSCPAYADAVTTLARAGDAYTQKNYLESQQILSTLNKKELADTEKVFYYKLSGVTYAALGNNSAAERSPERSQGLYRRSYRSASRPPA